MSEQKQVLVRLDSKLWLDAKRYCLESGSNLTVLITQLLTEHLAKQK